MQHQRIAFVASLAAMPTACRGDMAGTEENANDTTTDEPAGDESGSDPPTGSSEGDSGGMADTVGDPGDIDAFIEKFQPWPDPAAEAKQPEGEPEISEPVFDAHQGYECEYQSYDVTESYDRVLAVGALHSEVVPGALLQGGEARKGVYNTIPAARSPVTVSVNVPIANPVRVIENPTVANLQAAIAAIQADIDAELDVVPVQALDHETEVTESFEEASTFFGVDLDFSAPLVNVGIDTVFDHEHEVGNTSFSLRHVEELFTITFTAEEQPTPTSFFADDVTLEQLEELETAGYFGPENPPVFVKSVSYGRVVLASAATTHQYDSDAFAALINANALGSGASVETQHAYQQLAEQAQFKLLAMGVTSEDALAALHGAKIEDMFGPASALAAVPLYYEMHFMTGTRPTAKLGDAMHYTEQRCYPTGPEPCEWACGVDWSPVDLETCTQSGGGVSGNFQIWDENWMLNVNGSFAVPHPTDAVDARVCGSAQRTDGGIWNDGNIGFTVNCGNFSRAITRAELWSGVGWCWDGVPVDTACWITPGDVWTPAFQNAGWALATLSVDHYETPTRCYADEW